MPEQIKLFKNKSAGKNKKEKPKFESVIDGHGVETIERTEVIHKCFACRSDIGIGSKAEKITPVVDDKPIWHQAIYRHINPPCRPPVE